jgi:hypothetical protein
MSAAMSLIASLDISHDDEVLLSTLEGETDVLEVVKRLIRAALDAESMAAAANERIGDIIVRRDRFKQRAESARETARQMLEALEVPKLVSEDFTVSLRAGPPKVIVTEPEKLADEFVRVTVTRSPDKPLIKAAFDAGREVEGAVLSNGGVSLNALTPATTAEPAMLSFLQRAVADPGFDVGKFEVVLGAMREEQAKASQRAFYAAMAVAQGEMEPVRKDATNPSTRSKYARFEAIDAVVRPVYTRHGFSVSYRTGTPSRPGAVRVICTVAHEAGHSVEAELEAALDGSGAQGRSNKTDVQATGSTVSYLRRYILTMVWNIALASDDDDGEGSRPSPSPRPRPARAAYEPTSMRDMRPVPSPRRDRQDPRQRHPSPGPRARGQGGRGRDGAGGPRPRRRDRGRAARHHRRRPGGQAARVAGQAPPGAGHAARRRAGPAPP